MTSRPRTGTSPLRHWPPADRPENDLEKLEVDPFTNRDGTLVNTSKLKLGADGQLMLTVPEGWLGSRRRHVEDRAEQRRSGRQVAP